MFHHDSLGRQLLDDCWSLPQNLFIIVSEKDRIFWYCMMFLSSFLRFRSKIYAFFLNFKACFLFCIHLRIGIHLIIQMPNFSYRVLLFDCFGSSLQFFYMINHLFSLLLLFSLQMQVYLIIDYSNIRVIQLFIDHFYLILHLIWFLDLIVINRYFAIK